jgi:hypothetical protein
MGYHEIDYLEVSITAQNHSNFPIARVEHFRRNLNDLTNQYTFNVDNPWVIAIC